MRLWRPKRNTHESTPREPDPAARTSLEEARKALEKLHNQRSEVSRVARTLREIREENHFQELLRDALRGT